MITFHPGYLFRTPVRWSMWVSGPPNHIKDGVQPLTALVETDWLPFPFTMNWIFTRPGRVRFEKKEPFCFITLMQDKQLEDFELVQKTLVGDADLHGQYEARRARRDDSPNARLYKRDPAAVKEAWQRYYFKGEMPTDAPAPKAHVNKRRMRSLRLGG